MLDEISNQAWVAIGVSLISGGAAGAVINSIVTNYRNRVQPVYFDYDVKPFLPPIPGVSMPAIEFAAKKIPACELWHAALLIKNAGNLDFQEFNFSLAFENAECVGASFELVDEFRTIDYKLYQIAGRKTSISFACGTFNRRDEYHLNIFVRSIEEPRVKSITSKQSATFISRTLLKSKIVHLSLVPDWG